MSDQQYSDASVEDDPTQTKERFSRTVIWSVVFSLNLIVPLTFGSSVIAKGGGFGMVIAIICFWLLGAFAVYHNERLSAVLLSGGIVVAMSQILPFLQLYAGAASLELWDMANDGFGGGEAWGPVAFEFWRLCRDSIDGYGSHARCDGL